MTKYVNHGPPMNCTRPRALQLFSIVLLYSNYRYSQLNKMDDDDDDIELSIYEKKE